MRKLTAATGLACASLSLGAASCDAIFGLSDEPLLSDAGSKDSAPPRDAPLDTGKPCTFDATGAGTLSDKDCWSTFDATVLGAGVNGFLGAAFDGRFLYLAPATGGTVVRYDTQASFGSSAAWSAYDVSKALKGPFAFVGAVFDGRYVVFVPGKSATFVRYDTHASLDDASAWTSIDPTVGAGLSDTFGYAGGTYDGKALFFMPNESTYAQKFDTRRVFTDPSAWTAHHIVGGDAGPGFFGGAFDGRYLYMAPGTLSSSGFGILIRCDTTGDFSLNSAFITFDMTTIDPDAAGYTDAAFDGRYVYFAPSGRSAKAVAMRFDSRAAITDTSAWSSFDVTSLSASVRDFFGVAFDGRYLYLPPSGTTSTGNNGVLARYDTTAPFATAASWTTFDTNAIGAAAFQGTAFDGRHVYFAPETGGVVARFEARKTPKPPSPPGFPASFF